MPIVENTLVGYIGGAYVYMDSDGIFSAETTFVPDWRVDEDPRKVAGYVECMSQRFMDRSNDEYDADIDVRYSIGKGDRVTFGSAYRSTPVEPTYTAAPGYDVLSEGTVRCWYCDGVISYADYCTYRSWVAGRSNHHNATPESFVADMLVHYSEHRANGDLPYVRTYVKVGIRRPDGSVTPIPEHARRVTKPWQVKGALV